MSTAQELFDRAVNGVMAQGRRSTDNGLCRYRGNDGARCAVGHVVDDDEIATRMERCSLSGLVSRHKGRELDFELPPDLIEHEDLLCDLQVAHDRCRGAGGEYTTEKFRREFYDKVAKIARDRELSMDGVKKPEEYAG